MATTETKKETCGIIMPISGSEHYTSEHWIDVKNILDEVISDSGFIPNLVSDADEIGIIHNRIVSNIYNNPIIICDVSSKNPNVMFELGLRLAFDKATIIIKDDATNYNFDTAPIEHLTYPKDLRYSVINKFKSKLKDKLNSTFSASQKPEYSTFLKNFVQYKPKLEVEEISSQEYVLKQLDTINKQLSDIKRNTRKDLDSDKNLSSFSVDKLELQMRLEAAFVDFVLNQKGVLKNLTKREVFDDFMMYLSKNRGDNVIMSSSVADVIKTLNPIYDKLMTNPSLNGELELNK